MVRLRREQMVVPDTVIGVASLLYVWREKGLPLLHL